MFTGLNTYAYNILNIFLIPWSYFRYYVRFN